MSITLKNEITNLQIDLNNKLLLFKQKQLEESQFIEQNKKNLTEKLKFKSDKKFEKLFR